MEQSGKNGSGKRGASGSLAVLGSTGSIGAQTLDVVRSNPGRFRVVSLAAGKDAEAIIGQAREFKPEFIALKDESAAEKVRQALGPGFVVRAGEEAVCEAACLDSVHTVVAAVVGFAALKPVLAAVSAGKNLALANKECLVAAGPLLMSAVQAGASRLAPVDSEHNSVFQCLLARGNTSALRRVILTASGGPFRATPLSELIKVTPEDAVRHPRWNMGPKISVDSATLMNKGLEVVEAAVLFGLPAEKVEVLIHPQSLVHGLAEYADGTLLAALFQTDMRVPISFSLNYLYQDEVFQSDTLVFQSGASFLDLGLEKRLDFERPDLRRFPALSLAYEALRLGGSAPTVLNASNEIAVSSFLERKIGFIEISEVVEKVLGLHQVFELRSLSDVYTADSWAREQAMRVVSQAKKRGYAEVKFERPGGV